MHYIREKVIYDLVLADLQRVCAYVTSYEAKFVKVREEWLAQDRRRELAAKKRELEKSKKRIAEIDNLILKLYEDNAKGKLTDERFATMLVALETEQKGLKEVLPQMEEEFQTQVDEKEGIELFIKKVKAMSKPTELTAELVNDFIEKIVVSKPVYIDGKRHQTIDIYYKGVGMIE